MSSVLFRFNSGLKAKALNFIKNSNSYEALRTCSTKTHLNVQTKEAPNTSPDTVKTPNMLDKLLQTNVKKLDHNSAINLLTNTSKYCTDKNIIISSKHTEKIIGTLNVIEHRVPKLAIFTLIDCLRSLLILKVNPDSHFFQSVENEILWKMKNTSLKNLTFCLNLYEQHNLLKVKANFIKQLVAAIETRIFEISSPKEVVRVLAKSTHFSKNFLGEIEGRALELLPQMNNYELLLIYGFLKESKARCLPLIRGLGYYVNKNLQSLTVNQCLELLSAIQTIQVSDYVLLNRISEDLLVNIKSLTTPKLISALIYVGQLRWKHKDLLAALSELIEERFDQLKLEELNCFVTTLSFLDYMPKNGRELLNKIEGLAQKSEFKQNAKLFNLVWNMAILGHNKLLPKVLDPEFSASVLSKSDLFLELSKKLKLIQLDAFNQLYFSQKSIISESFEFPKIPQTSLDSHLNDSILSMLKGLIPDSNKVVTQLDTKMGFHIIAEFIADKDCKILPIQEYGVQAGIKHSDLKPLPDHCSRIAVIGATYKDYTQHSEELNGLARWKVDMLSKAGYKVMLIPYKDLFEETTLETRLAYLKRNLKQIMTIKEL